MEGLAAGVACATCHWRFHTECLNSARRHRIRKGMVDEPDLVPALGAEWQCLDCRDPDMRPCVLRDCQFAWVTLRPKAESVRQGQPEQASLQPHIRRWEAEVLARAAAPAAPAPALIWENTRNGD